MFHRFTQLLLYRFKVCSCDIDKGSQVFSHRSTTKIHIPSTHSQERRRWLLEQTIHATDPVEKKRTQVKRLGKIHKKTSYKLGGTDGLRFECKEGIETTDLVQTKEEGGRKAEIFPTNGKN